MVPLVEADDVREASGDVVHEVLDHGSPCSYLNVYLLPAQPIDATQALNLSAGVWNAKVSRGRSLSWRATLLR
jgi:hypothetical protein